MKCFAKKIGMTHFYDESGSHQVATVLELTKTALCGERSEAKDGYNAKIYGELTAKKSQSKSLNGQFKGISGLRKVREDKGDQANLEMGTAINSDMFKVGETVTVRGISKGKGFSGTIKRHGFTRGPKTHGSNNYRQPGSIGDTGPGRVIKGKKMSGRMGQTNVKIKGVAVVKVEKQLNRIWVSTPVPGSNQQTIIVDK